MGDDGAAGGPGRQAEPLQGAALREPEGPVRRGDDRQEQARDHAESDRHGHHSGGIDGGRVGVTLMPHPENLRRSWFHARDYGLLVAEPFEREALRKGEKNRVVVKAGETPRFWFGVLVHRARPNLAAAYRDHHGLAGMREGR